MCTDGEEAYGTGTAGTGNGGGAKAGGAQRRADAGRQMRRALKEIEAARRRLAEERGQEARPAAEWLLDNAYLAQREGKDACRALSRCPRRLRRDGAELFIGVLARTLAETGTVGTGRTGRLSGGVQRGRSAV